MVDINVRTEKIALDMLKAEKIDIFSSSNQLEDACLNTEGCAALQKRTWDSKKLWLAKDCYKQQLSQTFCDIFRNSSTSDQRFK